MAIILSTFILLFSCSTPVIHHKKDADIAVRSQDRSYFVYRAPASFWDIFKPFKPPYRSLTEEEKESFPSLVERSYVWREKAFTYFNILQKYQKNIELNAQEQQLIMQYTKNADEMFRLSDNKDETRPLTSFLVKNLHKTFTEYHNIYDSIKDIVEEGQWIFKKNYEISVRSDVPTGEDRKAWQRFQQAQFMGEIDEDEDFVQPFYINPFDEKGKELVLMIKRTLATGLLFYDNYNYAIHFYQSDKKLRLLLNYDSEKNYKLLAEITRYFHSFTYFRRIGDAIDLYHKLAKFDQRAERKYSEFEGMTNEIIEHSQMYQIFDEISTISLIGDKFKYYGQVISTSFSHTSSEVTNSVSQVFGNTAGRFQSREGKLKSMSESEKQSIISQLKPLDILLEKTPFRLTDKFIPGHWGHAAIWVGNEEQLKALGIWDHPAVKPYQFFIKKGHSIVEALRPGVQINTFSHFLDIDDLAVLRYNDELDEDTQRRYLINAFEQIGKEYDFNFDVETDKKIVCSELVYVVYDDMVWQTDKAMGRYTISPDNVANKVVIDHTFHPVMVIHDGKKVTRPYIEQFKYLLEGEYNKVSFEIAH